MSKQTLTFVLTLFFGAGIILYSGCSKDDEPAETCSDGIQNQGETDVDCGGPCTPCASCSDGIQNQGETGIDCGGPCAACPASARDTAVLEYNTNYLGSAISNPGWTGNIAGCIAGTVPQSTHDAVIKRLNYFRRMVGLNGNCTLDATKFAMEQDIALMMDANGMSNHFPPTSWLCYTSAGATAAASSNLYYGVHGTNAVTGFIQDPGASNTACGHRRWILYSTQDEFSYGTTDGVMALYVFNSGSNTQIPAYIAYPPKGYIPQQLVFARWSFGIPNADFAAATVTMTGPSGNVPLTIVYASTIGSPGYGDRTLVWEPTAVITNSTSDITYTVSINGIAGAPNSSYTYNVVIIKP